jgi:hypothetical protein
MTPPGATRAARGMAQDYSNTLSHFNNWTYPLFLPQLCLISLLDPLIQRFQHTCVHRGDHVDRRIQLFFRHSRFPCVRKAAFHSWIAKAHHRDGEADEHLLAFAEAFDGVSIAIKGSKVGFFQFAVPLYLAKRVAQGAFYFALCSLPFADLLRLYTADQRVGETPLDVDMVAVSVPGKIIFLQAFRQFRRLRFQLFRRL